jgi:hypothetical protein
MAAFSTTSRTALSEALLPESPTDVQPAINPTIWMYWNGGFENAPEVVRLCLRSWKFHNLGWRVVELSDANIGEHVDEETLAKLRGLRNITIQKFANLLRLYLISRHGGVWADATCFCRRPLDDWLHDYMASGFFAFRRRADKWLRESRNRSWLTYAGTSGDRIFASWFLAAIRGNPLASTFFAKHLELFETNSFSLQGTREGSRRRRLMKRVLRRNAGLSQLWAHPAVMRAAKVYPYFIIHYHFARLVTHDRVCRDIWDATPAFLASDLTSLVRFVVSPVTDSLMRDLTRPQTPMHKLTWKYRHKDFREGCVLDYLARSLG